MKPLLLFLISIATANQTITNVYICGSGKVDKYHLKKNCKTNLEKAKKDKKMLCKWEE